MGQTGSHNGTENEGLDAYHYPPPAGPYFGSQFIMGGEEFDSVTPESFLFGEMNDLNFLARLPGAAPFIPQNIQHTNTIRGLLSVSKDSVRIVRTPAEDVAEADKFHVEFMFDADADCHVTLYFAAEEHVQKGGQIVFGDSMVRFFLSLFRYRSKYEHMTLGPFECTKGYAQKFSHQHSPIVGLSSLTFEDMIYHEGKLEYPLVISVETWIPDSDGSETSQQHSHVTFCALQAGDNGSFSVHPLIQKLNIEGLSYILKEIYGIEQKDEEHDDNSEENQAALEEATECVVWTEANDCCVK